MDVSFAVFTPRVRCGILSLIMTIMAVLPARAVGPIETSVFAVQGIDVDKSGIDAAVAKEKAIMDAIHNAFFILIERLASKKVAQSLKNTSPLKIASYMKSISIEEEHTAPGRYIGKFTVRFLPAKIQPLLTGYGVSVVADQADPLLILPIWKTADGYNLWETNPWRTAWLDLKGVRSTVPLLVPLGDIDDSQLINAQEALRGDSQKLTNIEKRYDVKTALVALAEPLGDGSIRVIIGGDTLLGRIDIDEIYRSHDRSLETACVLAVENIQSIFVEKYRRVQARLRAEAQAQREAAEAQRLATSGRSLSVAVPFTSTSQWNGIRARILSAQGVLGVDITTLSGNGALIHLAYSGPLENLNSALAEAGLNFERVGGTWVIQAR